MDLEIFILSAVGVTGLILLLPIKGAGSFRYHPPSRINPQKISRFISGWLKRTGAHSVGFTQLKEYHLYSHKGRGARSGKPIRYTRQNAIAITVEMDHRMMKSAPGGSSVMESCEQYLNSGVLALKLAAFIRELGFEATAHNDPLHCFIRWGIKNNLFFRYLAIKLDDK